MSRLTTRGLMSTQHHSRTAMNRTFSNKQSGISLAEVMAGIAIMSIMILATVTVSTTATIQTRRNTDKEFATQKAITMLEELRAVVQIQSGETIRDLDAFDDGTANKPTLTTDPKITDPSASASGNIPFDLAKAKWKFERRISVQRLPGQSNDARIVNVKVFRNVENRAPELLAEVASVIRTLVTVMPPSQVYDVYVIACENVPGWWVYMSNIVPFVNSAINDLTARNPGLVFRVHNITTLSYGRDQQYTPYMNVVNDSKAAVKNVYFYPAIMPDPSNPANSVGNGYYYYPSLFQAHIAVDDVTNPDLNGSLGSTSTAHPYALADQYNNSMRYYEELSLYNARAKDDPNEQLTLRLLIDDMYARPWKYTNAILINLHGELLPFPPVRNYSDAAKDPSMTGTAGNPNLRNVRVVTHPENLRYLNSDNVNLRVYSYKTDADDKSNQNSDKYLGASLGPQSTPITLKIYGIKSWTPTKFDINAITGGLDVDSDGVTDLYQATQADTCSSGSKKMCYDATSILDPNDSTNTTYVTTIHLWNSPLITPQDAAGGGLFSAARLYNMEYIPSPVEDLTTGATPFSINLTTPDPGNQKYGIPKNTARWVLTIPKANMFDDKVIKVETRIGSDVTVGTYSRKPHDLSSTYVYRGTDAYLYTGTSATDIPAALPITEQYQFMGDPRHLPYADLKRPHVGGVFGANESPLGMRYNRFFDDFEDGFANVGVTTLVSSAENFDLSTNNIFSYYANGNATLRKVTLGKSSGLQASKVATSLNNDGTFNGYAFADTITANSKTYLRIRTLSSDNGNSFRLEPSQTTSSTNATDALGFRDKYLISSNVEPFDLSTKNIFAYSSDGGTTKTVTLTANATQTASSVAATLNADGTFSGVAYADVYNDGTGNRLRVRTRSNSIWFDTAKNSATNAGPQLGLTSNLTTYRAPWAGWRYSANFGISNSATLTSSGVTNTAGGVSDDNYSGGGNMEVDVTRIYQALRTALVRSNAIWTTMTGYSYYYLGLGNEIGYDSANGFPNSVPVNAGPFTGDQSASINENSIIASCGGAACNPGGVKYIKEFINTDFWWGITWLGELYPDSMYKTWKDTGNLPTPSTTTRTAGTFVRVRRPDISSAVSYWFDQPPGTTFNDAVRRTGGKGCVTLFWSGTSSSATFHHAGTDGKDADIMSAGQDIANAYNFPVPSTIPNARPFKLDADDTGNNPQYFLSSVYDPVFKTGYLGAKEPVTDSAGTVTYSTVNTLLYKNQSNSWDGSSIIYLQDPNTNNTAFIAVNGLSPTDVSGAAFIARWAFLTLVHTYFTGGLYTDTAKRVVQLPRVNITKPDVNTDLTEPTNLNPLKINWALTWKRWDNEKYTPAYADTFPNTDTSGNSLYPTGAITPAEKNLTMKYAVLYSNDNGLTWKYVQDDLVAKTGVAPDATHTVSTPNYDWYVNDATKFPEGGYVIRVEGYRAGYLQHYSYHAFRGYIRRKG
jgi:Tfp pilus assembly protein PilV